MKHKILLDHRLDIYQHLTSKREGKEQESVLTYKVIIYWFKKICHETRRPLQDHRTDLDQYWKILHHRSLSDCLILLINPLNNSLSYYLVEWLDGVEILFLSIMKVFLACSCNFLNQRWSSWDKNDTSPVNRNDKYWDKENLNLNKFNEMWHKSHRMLSYNHIANIKDGRDMLFQSIPLLIILTVWY